MDPRTTTSGRAVVPAAESAPRSHRRPPSGARRTGLFLGVAAAGAVLVNVVAGTGPAAQAEPGTPETVSVAARLAETAQIGPTVAAQDLRPLEELAASRSSREAEQTAAQQVQAAADQAELDRRQAEADAAAKAQAEAEAAKAAEAAAAAAAEAAEEQHDHDEGEDEAAGPASAAATYAAAVAKITNSTGPVKPQVQRAADQVVSNVPGAGDITLGGTRASATDPGGHPSGLALDYMVMTDAALGDAIAQYHIDHWSELGVQYVIWEQRMLSSPNGSWKPMEDRGGATANHFDHVHVNYR